MHVNNQMACRDATRKAVLYSTNGGQIVAEMACRNATRKAILYSTVGGQIVVKMVGSFSENYFTKTKTSRPCGQILLTSCQNLVKGM